MPTLLHYPPGIGFSAAVGSLLFAAIALASRSTTRLLIGEPVVCCYSSFHKFHHHSPYYMSQEFTTFANLCIAANSGIRSFDFVNEWLLQNSGNEDLLLSEGPIDFLLKFKAPIEVLHSRQVLTI
jgi:hypothetical protein